MMKQVLQAATVAIVMCASTLAYGAEASGSGGFQQMMDDFWAQYQNEFHKPAGEEVPKLADMSLAARQARLEPLGAFVQRLEAIPEADLSEADRTGRNILLRSLRDHITRSGYGDQTILFRKHGTWNGFLDLLMAQPIVTKAQFEGYIANLNDFPRFNAQGIATSREALRQSFVQSCYAIQGLEKTIQIHLVDDASKSEYLKLFARKPSGISDADWAALKSQAEEAVRDRVIPALRELEAFFLTEYAPNCRESVGISTLPGGAEQYAALVRAETTTDLSPDEIHEIGLKEVERIRAEMDEAVERSGFKGDRAAFVEMLRTDPRFYAKSGEELLMRARALAKQVDGELPKLFGRLPRLPYAVNPLPPRRADSGGVAYYEHGDTQENRAGAFVLDTSRLDQRPLYELPALTLHEAVPGHHLQVALQQELDLPEMRRYWTRFTAFNEGWALYAERLGYDMGLYDDPYAEFGRLSHEMWRACRLVVDTGIHAKGWTREQAIDFMFENTALTRHNIEFEVNRYINWPAQALGYKIGEMKIRELRERAEKALGERFDIRAFHDAVLENGSIPLDVLEAHINGWIAKQQQQVDQTAA